MLLQLRHCDICASNSGPKHQPLKTPHNPPPLKEPSPFQNVVVTQGFDVSHQPHYPQMIAMYKNVHTQAFSGNSFWALGSLFPGPPVLSQRLLTLLLAPLKCFWCLLFSGDVHVVECKTVNATYDQSCFSHQSKVFPTPKSTNGHKKLGEDGTGINDDTLPKLALHEGASGTIRLWIGRWENQFRKHKGLHWL